MEARVSIEAARRAGRCPHRHTPPQACRSCYGASICGLGKGKPTATSLGRVSLVGPLDCIKCQAEQIAKEK